MRFEKSDGCYFLFRSLAYLLLVRLLNISGGPQGIAACEHVIEHLAVACKVHKDTLRRMNMYNDQHTTHFGNLSGAS